MTDFLLIACCHRFGKYLTETRRMRANWATQDVFQVWWEELERYNGLSVRTICAPELNNIFEEESSKSATYSWTLTHLRGCTIDKPKDCC